MTAIFDLVEGRRGHFRMESGYHSSLWFELDGLFDDPAKIEPSIARLADLVRPHQVDAVCGPATGGAILAEAVARVLGVPAYPTEKTTSAGRDGLFTAMYRLKAGVAPGVDGKRVAIVDDVMSAGSSLRATLIELESHGAVIIVAGALLVLGDVGSRYFEERGITVEAPDRSKYDLWAPSDCPLCSAGVPLEDPLAK